MFRWTREDIIRNKQVKGSICVLIVNKKFGHARREKLKAVKTVMELNVEKKWLDAIKNY